MATQLITGVTAIVSLVVGALLQDLLGGRAEEQKNRAALLTVVSLSLPFSPSRSGRPGLTALGPRGTRRQPVATTASADFSLRFTWAIGASVACGGSSSKGSAGGGARGDFPLCIVGWWRTYTGPCDGASECQKPGGATATATAYSQSDCLAFGFSGYTIEGVDGGSGYQGYAGGGAVWSAKARLFVPGLGIYTATWGAAPPDQVTTIDSIGQENEQQVDCVGGGLVVTGAAGTQSQLFPIDDSALISALNAHGAEGPWNAIGY